MQLSPDEKRRLALRAGTVFSPAAPIRARDVFAGRTDQVRRTVDAINQSGQHALIYGERGVGKTSLANVIAGFLESVGQTNIIAQLRTKERLMREHWLDGERWLASPHK